MFLDYNLPSHLIAQEPSLERDASRLMVVSRTEHAIAHNQFRDLPELLKPHDLLILNNTRVLHARLLGQRARTGGKWEGLFLRQLPDGTWEMLCQTRGKPEPGETIVVPSADASPPLVLTLVARLPEGRWQVRAETSHAAADVLEQFGHVPLPPYIRKGVDNTSDRSRYQTVYAEKHGAVAAPTAGLHFTPELFERLRARQVDWAFVTLHVGLGTFQPLQSGDFTHHRMHQEWGELTAETAAAIQACRVRGGRVIAVGTTSVRVLETVGQACSADLQAWRGETDIYIYPPFTFRVVDGLITNFHLPRTTLLLLVSALAGTELIRTAYETAIAQEYRFFSYGDAMLIL